jgi:hypothetical protein
MSAAAGDTDLQVQVTSDLGDLIRKLPHDIRVDSEDPALKAAMEGDVASLITQAGAYLSVRLAAEKV